MISFLPAIASGGLLGWSQIQRTQASEISRMEQMPEVATAKAYAREKLAALSSLDGLMEDRRLLETVLTSVGLEANIDDTALVRKALAEGTGDESFAKKLGDDRWTDLAGIFNFDQGFSGLTGTAIDQIMSDHSHRLYSTAVEEEYGYLGVSLRAEGALAELAEGDQSETAKWYSVIGNDDLREVFQNALGLPESLWTIDVEDQVSQLERAFQRTFGGDFSSLAEPEQREKLLTRHVVVGSMSETDPFSGGQVALSLLQAQYV